MTTHQTNLPIQWARLLVCGLITGFVWSGLSIILIAVLGDAFFTTISAGRFDAPDPNKHPLLFLINHACGIWGLWLFAVVRSRFNTSWKAAMVAGMAWWVIASLQSLKWLTLAAVPFPTIAVPLVATLPSMMLAVFVGGYLYEK